MNWGPPWARPGRRPGAGEGAGGSPRPTARHGPRTGRHRPGRSHRPSLVILCWLVIPHWLVISRCRRRTAPPRPLRPLRHGAGSGGRSDRSAVARSVPHGWLQPPHLARQPDPFFSCGLLFVSEERDRFAPQREPQSVWSSMKLLERKCSWKGRPALSRMSAGALVRLCTWSCRVLPGPRADICKQTGRE